MIRTDLRSVWLPLVVCVLIQALVSATALAVAVMAPVLAPALGVEPVAAGGFISLVYVTASLASLRAALLLRKFGPFGAALLSLLAAILGLAILLYGTLSAALLSGLVIGVGYGLTSPATSELLARVTKPQSRALVFSIKQAGVPIGGMAAGLAVPLFLTISIPSLSDWQAAILLIIAINCAFLLAFYLVRLKSNDPPVDGRRLDRHIRLREIMRSPESRLLIMSSFIFAGFQLSVAAYLVIHLTEIAGMSLGLAGSLFALSQFCGVIGRFFWGIVADLKKDNRLILLWLAAGMAVFGTAAAFIDASSSVYFVMLVCVGLGATINAWTGIYMAELIREADPGRAGEVTGLAMTVTFAGVVIGPLVFAFASMVLQGYAGGYVFFACMAALCSLLMASQIRRSRLAH